MIDTDNDIMGIFVLADSKTPSKTLIFQVSLSRFLNHIVLENTWIESGSVLKTDFCAGKKNTLSL